MPYLNLYTRLHSGRRRFSVAWLAVWRFSPSRFYLPIALFWQLLAWWQAWFIYHNLAGDLLVLHYNVDFGVDLVGDPYLIFWYPFFGLAVSLLSWLLTILASRQRDFKIIAHLLLGGAAFFGLLLSLALLAIYLINFF